MSPAASIVVAVSASVALAAMFVLVKVVWKARLHSAATSTDAATGMSPVMH